MTKLKKVLCCCSVIVFLTVLVCGCNKHTAMIAEGTYLMQDCNISVAPYVNLEEKDGQKKFEFVNSYASSYISCGSYAVEKDGLILSDENGNVYIFNIDGINLVFNADKSSELAEYEGFPYVTDKSVFVLSNN